MQLDFFSKCRKNLLQFIVEIFNEFNEFLQRMLANLPPPDCLCCIVIGVTHETDIIS